MSFELIVQQVEAERNSEELVAEKNSAKNWIECLKLTVVIHETLRKNVFSNAICINARKLCLRDKEIDNFKVNFAKSSGSSVSKNKWKFLKTILRNA